MAARNALFVLLLPALLVAAGLVLLASRPAVPVSFGAVMPALPYMLGVAVMVLGAWFKTPRMVLMAALVMGAHAGVAAFVPNMESAGLRGAELVVLYAAMAILFPLNAALIAFKRERGLMSRGVLARVMFIIVQVAAVLVVWDAGEAARAAADEMLHVRLADKFYDYWSLLPQPALLTFAVVSASLLVRATLSGSAIDGGLFGAVTASALAMHGAGQGHLPAIMFAMALLALLAAQVQENYRLAYIDELTGLPGRRALMHDLQAQGGAYAVAMLDVDHFKKFNDTYGHDVGDQVLKMVAVHMMRVGGGGRAYRYGGEEFTVLFPRKGQDHALLHLDRLRQSIAAAGFKLRDGDRPKDKPVGVKEKENARGKTPSATGGGDVVSVTISIGAHVRKNAQTPDETLKAADKALYKAKAGGRNRVSV